MRYVTRYTTFLLLASVVVAARHLRRPYDLVQVHSMPDILVLAGLIPRLLGARVVLDLHEVMPEFFATKFGRPISHPAVKLVVAAERLSIKLADHALTCTEQMRDAFVSRGAPAEKITVILNSADENVFRAVDSARPSSADRFTLVCHGSIEERYGLDVVVEALALLPDELSDVHFDIYGDGAFRPRLERLAEDRGVADRVPLQPGLRPDGRIAGRSERRRRRRSRHEAGRLP